MTAALRYALARLAGRRARALLAAGGIAAASAMLAAALTVGYSLGTGFDRAAARAHLPDAIARFDEQPLRAVSSRAETLPNVRALAYRLEVSGLTIRVGERYNEHATLAGILPGPRGYAIVAGRDLSGRRGEVVVERGLARAWRLGPGDRVTLADYRGNGTTLTVVGVAVAPETVAFPLAKGPRLWAPYQEARRFSGTEGTLVNVALLWTHDPSRLDVTLAQARAASFGLTGLVFVTRAGIRILLGRAAGIVIALLIAFSVVALGAAGFMLAASAHTEVQRRTRSIGVLRALGATRGEIASAHAVETAVVALPAAALGILLGWAAVARPTGQLLVAVNELGPGLSLAALLLASLAAVVALVAGVSAWAGWRVASRPPADALTRADVLGAPRRMPLPAGAAGLGMRLALARPLRTAGTVAVVAASVAVVLLILTIAGLLQRLGNDPAAVGKRYQLTVSAPARETPAIRALPGVADAAARYEVDAADSFDLGESFRLIAFAGDHTRFEAPELAEGRRLSGPGEAEVGTGLATALNVHPGATIAAQLPTGAEVRYRVVGLVRVFENDGRVAYVRPERLLTAATGVQPSIAIRVVSGQKPAVRRELERRGLVSEQSGGVAGEAVSGFAARSSGFLALLVALLRGVGVLVGVVCLYVLAQMLALTAQERRRAVAVVRACGGSRRQVALVFAGSALVVAVLAAPGGILLERLLLGPIVSRLAAAYVTLPLTAGVGPVAVAVVGLFVAALAAAAWVGRGAVAQPVVTGLREE